ncbi:MULTISPECIES: HK97 gp10 family phage protein [Clostridium]|uniref:HK97 gp10 family phage protein n=1 Tax=Clostridium TaxID=1485 RepID=UPI000DE8AA0F|nr:MULTISPECIES: HK97 gp10 family phage protein [Clostridium]AXB84589.1 HK97 gp10 family phage protein [Clostridium butyricum]MDU4587038.1 HK97 gp10 family phage protein [Clostridium sp.]MZI79382.1 HK97 gp10 family phage protein [Clostridium butyricum]
MSNTFGFEEFIKKIQETHKRVVDVIDETLLESATECVGEIQSRTGVKTGNLRRSATSGEIKVTGSKHSIKVGYDTDRAPYAGAYENGHKQTPGRYVPAIGKKLKKSYVPGKHVVRDSLILVRYGMDEKLKTKLRNIR